MKNASPSSPPESPNSLLNRKIQEFHTLLKSLDLAALPLRREPSFLKGDVGFVELFLEYEIKDISEEEIEEEEVVEVDELGVEHFDKFSTRDELAYHLHLLRDPSQPFFRRFPTIVEGNPSNLKIPCNIGHEILRNYHGHNLSKGNIIKIFYHGLSEITEEVLNATAGDDMPMSREEEAKFMKTFGKTRFYNDYCDRDSNRDNWRSSGRNDYNRDNYRSNTDDKSYDLQKQFNDFMKSQQSTNTFIKETFMDLKTQLETVVKNHHASIKNLETKFDRLVDKQSSRPSG
nr:reverse transcriptase domain-containing protein [Tanacetum cinerariifolium]